MERMTSVKRNIISFNGSKGDLRQSIPYEVNESMRVASSSVCYKKPEIIEFEQYYIMRLRLFTKH